MHNFANVESARLSSKNHSSTTNGVGTVPNTADPSAQLQQKQQTQYKWMQVKRAIGKQPGGPSPIGISFTSIGNIHLKAIHHYHLIYVLPYQSLKFRCVQR